MVISIRARAARALTAVKINFAPKQRLPKAVISPRESVEITSDVLGPNATLRRGYSITMNERGKIIRTIAAIRPKMKIRTRVIDGEFSSEIY